jgi:hypothetical protein
MVLYLKNQSGGLLLMKKQPLHLLARNISFVSAALLVFMVSGCNIPATVVINLPNSTTTLEPVQNTPESATATLTTTPTLTLTPITTGTAIVFSPGATAAVRTGNLLSGEQDSYTLAAQKNQAMILIADSHNNDISLAVYRQDASVLLDPSHKWNTFQWLLPGTETYTIKVIGGTIQEDYTLTVKVAAQLDPITSGSSRTITGSTVNGYVLSYGLNSQAGKIMTLSLSVPASSAYLDVFGIATGPVLDQSLHLTSWSGALPSTQDYIIEIIPTAGQVVNFSLTISIN